MIALGLVYSLHIAIFIFFEILTFRRLLFEFNGLQYRFAAGQVSVAFANPASAPFG